MWNDFPYMCTVFDTGKLDGFKGAVNRWCFPELCFLPFSVAQVLVGLRKQFTNNFVFPTWASAAGFNYYNDCMGFINTIKYMYIIKCVKMKSHLAAH